MSNRNYPKIVTTTTLIPFDNPVTAIAPKTITGTTAFTKYTTNAQAGYGAIIRVIANGSNVPDLSAFKKIGSGSYDNTNGVVNQLWFIYDGTDYCVSITQPTTIGGGGGDTTPPSALSVSVENAEPNKVLIAYGETLDSGSVPATSAYTVTVNGSSRTVSAVNITGANVKVTFGGAAVISSDAVVLNYAVPGTNPIQDVAGNDAAALTGVMVSNNVTGPIDLTFASPLTQTAHVWQGTGAGSFNTDVSYAAEPLTSSANGIVYAQFKADSPEHFFGCAESPYNLVYGAIGAGCFITTGGVLYKLDTGVYSASGYTLSVDEYYGVRRTGSTWEVVVSTDAVTWTVKATLSWAVTSEVHVQLNMTGSAKCHTPKLVL